MPDDLEWPRRAIVGAIVVIGVARLASFAAPRLLLPSMPASFGPTIR
ncbi:hypothetical protein [Bradyrhizobium sp. CCBAU 11361]|nr:hypothetical protein [Bradyrhizobium sp. CCBAU 11361]